MYGNTNKPPKGMHHNCVKKRKKFGFVLRLMPPVLRLIQPAYYAPTLSKQNYRKMGEAMHKGVFFICQNIKSYVRYLKRMTRSLYSHTRHDVVDEITG